MSITPLDSIRRSQYVNWIRVRVTRTWRPKKFQTDNYDGLHYLLVDEKGDSIHAIIDEHDFMHTPKIKAGAIYDVYHVHVKANSNAYKIVDRDIEIGFNEMSTIIPEDACSIPRFAYHLIQFHDMEECFDNQHKLEKEKKRFLLADMYGCIKEVVPPRIIFIAARNTNEWICEVILENHRRETVRITLWSDLARDFDIKAVDKSEAPTFAVFTSLRMKKYKGDVTPTGTNHTCVILNPEIPQRVDYVAEFNKPGDRVRINKSRGGENIDESWKSILDLRQLDVIEYKDKVVLCCAKILRFPNHSGWWYNSCSVQRCSRQLKQKTDGSGFSCGMHGDQASVPVFRVFMTIKDEEDHITLTLIGRQAENLFGYSCLDLVNKRVYADQYELPAEITDRIGETHLFELKIGYNNEFVVKHVHPNPYQTGDSIEQDESNDVNEAMSIPTGENTFPATPNKVLERKRVGEPEELKASSGNKDKKLKRLEKGGSSTVEVTAPAQKEKEL